MGLIAAGRAALMDGYVGYYKPYATSHDELDKDKDFQEEVRNAARTLVSAVRLLGAASSSGPTRRRCRCESGPDDNEKREGRSRPAVYATMLGMDWFLAALFALAPAPECTPMTTIPLPPGGKQKIEGLTAGLHKFQCCIHPWMRAAIRSVWCAS
jgi:hypothetical protein